MVDEFNRESGRRFTGSLRVLDALATFDLSAWK